jgi:hypothetical protein
VTPRIKTRASNLGEPGRRRGRLVLGLIAAALALLVLFAQALASGSGADCPHGAISAIGPVDEQGRGDTTPDVRCLGPDGER